MVVFESQYYTTSQGRKKLNQLDAEIQRLIGIRHQNVLSVLAVKLHKPQSGAPPRLIVLSEQSPSLTMEDVLQDSDSLREERASVSMVTTCCTPVLTLSVQDYISQILTGLNAIHAADVVHRGKHSTHLPQVNTMELSGS